MEFWLKNLKRFIHWEGEFFFGDLQGRECCILEGRIYLFQGFMDSYCAYILTGRFGKFEIRRNKEAWSDLQGLEEIFPVIDWPFTT